MLGSRRRRSPDVTPQPCPPSPATRWSSGTPCCSSPRMRAGRSPLRARLGELARGSAWTPPTGPPQWHQQFASVERGGLFLGRGLPGMQNACLVSICCWSVFCSPKTLCPTHFHLGCIVGVSFSPWYGRVARPHNGCKWRGCRPDHTFTHD
jgi:hypothetical protein